MDGETEAWTGYLLHNSDCWTQKSPRENWRNQCWEDCGKSWKQHAELWLRGNSVFQGGTVGDGESHVTDTSSPTKLRSAEHAGLLSAPVFSESCLHPATLASGRGVHVHAREPLYPGRGMHLQKALGYLFLQHNYVSVCVSVCICLEGRPENIPSNIPYISHCVHCHVTGSQMHQVQGLTFSWLLFT